MNNTTTTTSPPTGTPGVTVTDLVRLANCPQCWPTTVRPSVGDAARAVIAGARIAYIDHDSIVIAIARALPADDEGTAAAAADLTGPAAVLAHADVRAVIDPALSLMPARQARAAVARVRGPDSPGQLRGHLVRPVRRRGTAEAVQRGVHSLRLVQPLAGRGERVPRWP